MTTISKITLISLCLLIVFFKWTIEQETTITPTTTTRRSYCAELSPYCSCESSPIVLKCDSFSDFSQLDFSLLSEDSLFRERTFEIELYPETPLILGNTLNLSPLKFEPNAKVILRNIDGFDITANPFKDVSDNNDLFLYVYESTARTVGACDINQLPANNEGLFSSATYVLFSNLTYSDDFCPLLFHRAKISFFEAYYMRPDNYLHFSDIANVPAIFDLETDINQFKITFAPNFVVDNLMLNKYVFGSLKEFNLDNMRLRRIEEDAFINTQKLTRILMTLENVEEFIRSSTNEWFNSLNVDVHVDYNNPQSVEDNRNRTLLVQVNNRNTGQSYLYPDEDLVYFQHFPHDRFVFYRLLTDTDIECTETMRFLLKNAIYYEPVSYLNTTSAYKCFIEDTITTNDIHTTTINTKPTTTKEKETVLKSTFLAVVIPLAVVSGILLILVIILFVKICCFSPKPVNVTEDIFVERF